MSDTPTARPWPCRTRRLTPEEVLAHLRAFCRDEMGVSEERVRREVVPDAPIERLTLLDANWLGLDSYDWVGFGPDFGLDLDKAWWDGWRRTHTIADLCADLAGRIEVPVFEPVTMLGRECETAGAFLAIRNMLAAEGADVEKLGPSSPVAPYLRRHSAVFGRVGLASSGRLPHVETPTRGFVAVYAVMMLSIGLTGLFTCGLGACGVAWPTALPFALVATLAVILGFAAFARRRAAGYPTDFRQLVFTLLGRKPRTA